MRVACIQLNSQADLAANIGVCEALVREAAGQGAQLIATPENTFSMQAPNPAGAPKPQAKAAAQDPAEYTMETHPGILVAQGWAKELGVWILIGSVALKDPRLRGDLKVNRSFLIAPDGNIAATYDKIHLFDVDIGDGQSYRESAKFAAGERVVMHTMSFRRRPESPASSATLEQDRDKIPAFAGINLGLSICYDLRFPHLYRALARQGAHILAVPSAFTQVTGEAHWHVLLRARAIENGCFVIAPAQCDAHPGGRKTYGHTLIVNPWGGIVAERDIPTPGIVIADLDLSEVEKVRARIPSLALEQGFF